MSLLSFFRSVYSLEVLDTRFTTTSSTSYKTVVDARGDPGAKDGQQARIASKALPSKWNTPEFFLYYLVVALSIPTVFFVNYTVSNPSDPRYHKFRHRLQPGWIFGREIDNSDHQYASFRQNIPYLALLLALHPLARKAWNKLRPLREKKTAADEAEGRLDQRASFDYTFAMAFLAALHGFSALKVLAILYINYNMAMALPRKYLPAATWIFNIFILFSNEMCNGYHFKDIATLIAGATPVNNITASDGFLVSWGSWMDRIGGIMPRWEILFNITVLRLISFNLDYYWSQDYRNGSTIEKKQLDPANLSERDRVTIPAPAKDFTFRNYLAYVVYAPLYLTGPIITFNDYVSQLRYPAASIETARTIRYAIRFVACLLTMEVVLHYSYVGAIGLSNPDWVTYTPAQLSLLSYMNLHVIWLKLLLPWRFFRLWSLLDGIDPPENMVRCVSDSFSPLSFWRAWHRSFNKWIIRYIWIPLGGADFSTTAQAVRSVGSYLLVFTFVALWHDIRLRLLIWAWLVVLFIVPEVVGKFLFPARKWENRPRTYRYLCGWGAVCNMLGMLAANLVGFMFGFDGLQAIVKGIFHDFAGVVLFFTAASAMFVGVQIMFEVRESEARRGVCLKC